MTTQQAPHTPPMWRKLFSLPHSPPGWWAVVLSSPVWALWVYAVLSEGVMPDADGVKMGVIFFGPLGIFAAFAGLVAVLRSHERSLLVWIAMVPFLIFLSLATFLVASGLVTLLVGMI